MAGSVNAIMNFLAVKGKVYCSLAECLLVSQEDLCHMELVAFHGEVCGVRCDVCFQLV